MLNDNSFYWHFISWLIALGKNDNMWLWETDEQEVVSSNPADGKFFICF